MEILIASLVGWGVWTFVFWIIKQFRKESP
jgi:hypothetical protein